MLPYNDYFEYYGPDYRLHMPTSNMENMNKRETLEEVSQQGSENCGLTSSGFLSRFVVLMYRGGNVHFDVAVRYRCHTLTRLGNHSMLSCYLLITTHNRSAFVSSDKSPAVRDP